MSSLPDYELSDRYVRTEGRVLLTGIQALARLPIEQLRRDRAAKLKTAAFISGYPGSPLGGFDLEMARAVQHAPDLTIVHEPAVNEELGATAVMGSQLAPGRPDASYDGVLGIWYGKAPGLDRACDALRHGVFAGASPRGGAVALVGDDPACKSSTMPSSSDATLVDLHMPIFYPGTIAECLELGLHAVAISRATGLWASMKIVTPIADGSGTIDLPVASELPSIPTVEIDGAVWQCEPSAQFLGPRMLEIEREFREVRLPLARDYGITNRLNTIAGARAEAWIGVVATGFTYYETLDALRRLGLSTMDQIEAAGIRLLHLRMPVPFDRDIVRSFAKGLDQIVVVEEKNPTLEWLVKDALYGTADTPPVIGKHDQDGAALFRSWGMLDADAIIEPLRRVLLPRLAERLQPVPAARRELIPLSVNRSPFFCSGCPHNWGTKVPEDSLVGAGTGCHGMTLLMDPERVGEGIGITAMGNEGTQWIGMEPFVEAGHLFQNYGDGTLFHSGQLAIQNCIAADKHMTFKVLYNSTVAMTGGQDARSSLSVPALAEMILAWGATAVAVTTDDPKRFDNGLPQGVIVRPREQITSVQELLRSRPGVTVLIHDQECAAELRRDRRRGRIDTPTTRVVINHRICEGCGDCGDVSNCLSVQPVQTPFGRKTQIDQASCNFDYSCLEGDCPAFMTVEVRQDVPQASTPMGELALPEPERSDREQSIRIRLAGIGGTGVVTAAQMIGTAAMLDGWNVHGLDQTGLSQKAGPVISDVVLSSGANASNLIGTGEVDLVLAFDALVAASDAVIKGLDRTTTVLAALTQTPTGRMITEPALAYPSEEIQRRLASIVPIDQTVSLDAAQISTQVCGGLAQANTVLIGAALQSGQLPISTHALERAIELNGVAVEANQAALSAGRRWWHERHRSAPVEAAPTTTAGEPPVDARIRREVDRLGLTAELANTVAYLATDLVAYQSRTYARLYLERVAAAHAAESALGGTTTELTQAVATSMHKLMAYKDEYEVARLLVLPETRQAAELVGGPGASISWQLHPPMLKALGLGSKIAITEKVRPAFTLLAKGKRLRGTAADPFGRTKMRRAERALPEDFASTLTSLYPRLTADNLDQLVAIAALPDAIRGYEELKLRRITEYEQRLADAVRAFREPI